MTAFDPESVVDRVSYARLLLSLSGALEYA